jgi:type I restriction enzyme S subunit
MPDATMNKLCEEKIPSGWRATSLASIADVRVSGVDKLARESEKPVRLCNYIDVYKNDYITGDLVFMQASATASEIERLGLHIGDVIITKDSETPDDIGISAVADYAAPDLVCGYHLALLRPNAEVDSTFLAKQLKHHRLARYFGQRANGLTRYGLPNAVIADAPIWLPELPEQRTIGAILRLIDQTIAKTEAVIAKLKQVRAGLLHDLLTRGLDENGQLRDPISHPEEFQDSPLGRIPREWNTQPLYKVANVIDSLHRTPEFSAEGLPMVRVTDIKGGYLRLSECYRVARQVYKEFTVNHKPRQGDIVLSRVGSYGISSLVNTDEPFCIGQNTVVITGHCNPRFLYEVLQSHGLRQQFDLAVAGSSQKTLSLRAIKEAVIPDPPVDEQARIADVLLRHSAQFAEEVVLLEKIKKLKSGLMNDLLTGRVRVPEGIAVTG